MPHDPGAWQRLATAALLGTERAAAGATGATGFAAVETILDAQPADAAEAGLLNAAGILSVYLRAGLQIQALQSAALESARDEECAACSRRLEGYLQRMLAGEHREVLPECLGELGSRRKLWPPHLLPDLLELARQQRDDRPLLDHVIGQRGQWLAAQNPEWRFVAGESPDLARWDTGSFDERLALLRQLRQTEPATTRALVQGTWKDDLPEHRAAFIELFVIGLSREDEIILENALDDRRKEVRQTAADLLARLPESALAARMLERSAPLIQYVKGSGGALKRLIGGKTSRLEVNLPEKCDKTMQRDGIELKPGRSGLGERAWWLMQILAGTPPRAWTQRFNTTPEELVALASETEWKNAMLTGWAHATVRHRDALWAKALIQVWIANLDADTAKEGAPSPGLLSGLAEAVPQAELESLLTRELKKEHFSAAEHPLFAIVQFVPSPWSEPFSKAVLSGVAWHLKSAGSSISYPLLQLLADRFSLRISPQILGQALQLLEDEPADRPPVYLNAVKRFVDTVHFRHDMLKEIDA